MNQEFYDDFSVRYDLWTSSDTYTLELINFYTDYFSKIKQKQTLVELGIGTGNIALEILKNTSHSIIGIDNAKEMLKQCHLKSKARGLDISLTLLEEDITNLQLEELAHYIYLPYRTLCHFVSLDAKQKLFEIIFKNLEVGGSFLFDCDKPNLERMKVIHNKPQLIYTKDEVSIYQLSKFNFDSQSIHVSVIDANRKKESANVHKYDFSWIEPEQMQSLLKEVGFSVVNVYGDTKKSLLEKDSLRQIYEVIKA